MTKETETRIKRLIGKVNTVEELHRIRKHASARIDLIHKREAEAERERIWVDISSTSPGDYLEATKSLDYFYTDRRPAIQRAVEVGDRWLLWAVQPRARRIWIIKPADEQDADELQARIREYYDTPKGARHQHETTVRSLNRLSSYLELPDMRRIGLRRADVDQTVEQA